MALAIGLTQKYSVLQAYTVLSINAVYSLYICSGNHFNFYLQWPFEMLVGYSAPLLHVCLVPVWMQAASCSCAASMLVLLPLIGYDLGDPKTVSTSVGYLLQVSIACRITFCFIKVGTGLCRTCYVRSVTAVWSQQFNTADSDGDGRVDRQEWIAHFGDVKGFDAYDIGHDGCVSHAEFLAYQKASRANTHKANAHDKLLLDRRQKFGMADVDNDGRINRQEWIAHFGDDKGFDSYDIGNDGSISRAEFLAYEEFAALDVDNNDGVNREEWIAHFGNDDGFDEHDVGNDGIVSSAEFLAALATSRTRKASSARVDQDLVSK